MQFSAIVPIVIPSLVGEEIMFHESSCRVICQVFPVLIAGAWIVLALIPGVVSLGAGGGSGMSMHSCVMHSCPVGQFPQFFSVLQFVSVPVPHSQSSSSQVFGIQVMHSPFWHLFSQRVSCVQLQSSCWYALVVVSLHFQPSVQPVASHSCVVVLQCFPVPHSVHVMVSSQLSGRATPHCPSP